MKSVIYYYILNISKKREHMPTKFLEGLRDEKRCRTHLLTRETVMHFMHACDGEIPRGGISTTLRFASV